MQNYSTITKTHFKKNETYMINEENTQQIEPVSSVMKVFAILNALAEHKSLGVTELSQIVMTSKSTVYRFLQTMKMLGFVSQEGDDDRYSLTLKLFEVSARALEHVHCTLVFVMVTALFIYTKSMLNTICVCNLVLAAAIRFTLLQ